MAGKQSRLSKIPTEQFKSAIEASNSMVELLEKLGYNRGNGSMGKYVRERALKENISLEHFNNLRKFTRNRGDTSTYSLDEICVENSRYSNRQRLKIRLIAEGYFAPVCDGCGIGEEWNGKPLSLQLDHSNGVYNDHRRENLRLLCPNCHSQTETFSGRNSRATT